jgi:hypothetical protein
MSREKWAMFALGVWLAGTLMVSVIATENFYTVDRLLADSPNTTFNSMTTRIGQSETRELLRYLSSELNRLYFRLWNAVQLVLGLIVLGLLWRNATVARVRLGVITMLVLVVLMIVWLTPQIVTVGRSLDFVPRDPPPPALARFGLLHGLYLVLELTKLLIGLIVTVFLARVVPYRAQPVLSGGR